MEIVTILYITLALILALGFSFFLYLHRRTDQGRKDYILFGLRATGIFLVLLLLINPKLTSTDYEIQKSQLVVLTDNSQSLAFLDQQDTIYELLSALSNDKQLSNNFDLNTINFGSELSLNKEPDFAAGQTNIYRALEETKDLFSGKPTAVVLVSDGNQSFGRDYKYFNTTNGLKLFPLVVGDTTSYKDLRIDRMNTNRYAFLNNRFPVEIFLNYSGEEAVESVVKISSHHQEIFREEIKFSPKTRSRIIRTDLPASSLGVRNYEVVIQPLEDEKNILNNSQKFAVEVIDERTSVLILSAVSHPDLGAIKKTVESNEQRSVSIKYLDDPDLKLEDFQLIVLYQVNRRFNGILNEIRAKNYNYLIVAGIQTDWNFLNSLGLGVSKNSINQSQEIFPVYNPTFSAFQFEDIGFDDFPPLTDMFGELKYQESDLDIMLFQEIQGVDTEAPLLAVNRTSPKTGFLLGENIWRWRAKSYLDNKSFQKFDDFFGKLVQNLSSNKRRDRLSLDYENFFYANQNVIVNAQFFDENYQFDPGRSLRIDLKNTDIEESFSSDLVLKNNLYQFNGGDLPVGNYNFSVIVAGETLRKNGNFEIVDYNPEQQFVSANLSGMQSLAENNKTELLFPGQLEILKQRLMQDESLKPVQISHQKTLPLIDWYYLLFILILVLAAEWFYRKYLGLI